MLLTFIGLLILYFAWPALLLVLLFKFFEEVFDFFGFWLIPALFGSWIGLTLLATSSGDPEAKLRTPQQALAASHVLGLSTPTALVLLGVGCLIAGLLQRCIVFARGRRTSSHQKGFK